MTQTTHETPDPPRVRLEGNHKTAMETGRNRLLVTGTLFLVGFLVIAGRLVDLSLGPSAPPRPTAHSDAPLSARADIIDRNGTILATSLPTASLYADPSEILDAEDAAAKLVAALPGLSRSEVLLKLRSRGRFVWIKRNLTPKQQYAANRLGLPGLSFRYGQRRVYPHARAAAHLMGLTDVDGRGIAGVERYFEKTLARGGGALRLSIDLRVQAMLRGELSSAMTEFSALGAAGVVQDVRTGELLAMVSLPDYDPNVPVTASGEAVFNRVTKGVYEMGSTFKLFTAAMALDSGTVTLRSGYDASQPIRVARFTISDYHGKNRWLSVPEILVYSSNIGAAKMAVDVGTKAQRAYLGRLGLLRAPGIELPEVGLPLTPARWREINTMTISYGHGVAVSPLQMTSAVAAMVNGGIWRPATLLRQDRTAKRGVEEQVLSRRTSEQMRQLMRLVVSRGTGRKADAPGYGVGGKTGTADKQANGGYSKRALISSFVGAFPMDDPRYVLLALLDEPKGTAKTKGYATGGWVAAPVVRRMVERMGPLLGILPEARGAEPEMPAPSVIAKARTAPKPEKTKKADTAAKLARSWAASVTAALVSAGEKDLAPR